MIGNRVVGSGLTNTHYLVNCGVDVVGDLGLVLQPFPASDLVKQDDQV